MSRGILIIGLALFLASVLWDGRIDTGDIRAAGVVVLLCSVGVPAYRRLRQPYRRLGDADLIDALAYISAAPVEGDDRREAART